MGHCNKCDPKGQYLVYRDTVWPSMRALSDEIQMVAHAITDRMRDEGVSLRESIEHKKRVPRKPVEIGDKFNRLTVKRKGKEHLTWEVECSCPDKTRLVVRQANLYSGNTKSCGCLKRESIISNGLKRRKYSKDEYTVGSDTHVGMMKRCYDKKHKNYDRYGGRGITVCKAWHNCERFIKDLVAEIGPRKPGMSLDRINNDKGYRPGNVRWATPREQAANRGSSIYLSCYGETKTIADWARDKRIVKLGITEQLIRLLHNNGLPDKVILSTKVSKR